MAILGTIKLYTHTFAALKVAITEKIQAITQEECARVIKQLIHHIQQYLQLKSGLLKHVLLGVLLLSSCLRLNGADPKLSISLPFHKCNLHYSISYGT